MYDMSHSTRDRWEIDRRSIIMQQLLGEGMYGQVWQGRSSYSLMILCGNVSECALYDRQSWTIQSSAENLSFQPGLRNGSLKKCFEECIN